MTLIVELFIQSLLTSKQIRVTQYSVNLVTKIYYFFSLEFFENLNFCRLNHLELILGEPNKLNIFLQEDWSSILRTVRSFSLFRRDESLMLLKMFSSVLMFFFIFLLPFHLLHYCSNLFLNRKHISIRIILVHKKL